MPMSLNAPDTPSTDSFHTAPEITASPADLPEEPEDHPATPHEPADTRGGAEDLLAVASAFGDEPGPSQLPHHAASEIEEVHAPPSRDWSGMAAVTIKNLKPEDLQQAYVDLESNPAKLREFRTRMTDGQQNYMQKLIGELNPETDVAGPPQHQSPALPLTPASAPPANPASNAAAARPAGPKKLLKSNSPNRPVPDYTKFNETLRKVDPKKGTLSRAYELKKAKNEAEHVPHPALRAAIGVAGSGSTLFRAAKKTFSRKPAIPGPSRQSGQTDDPAVPDTVDAPDATAGPAPTPGEADPGNA